MSNKPAPRYEFRAFAQSFGRSPGLIRRGRVCRDISETEELYLIARAAVPDVNVKLRAGRLQIKQRVDTAGVLERWLPAADEPLPLPHHFLEDTLLPLLGTGDRAADRAEEYPFTALVSELRQHGVFVCKVFKRRSRFDVDGCAAEIDEVLVNGAAIGSIAVESEDAGALQSTIEAVGLTAYENVSYPFALRRILGLDSSEG